MLPENLPKLSLTLIGDGENVRTRAQLDFAKPLPYSEEKWNIPTNLISQPLVSFTAIRGIAPWLSSLKAWNDLLVGAPPNQFYLWDLQAPLQTFFAAPQPDASNQVSRLTDSVLQKGAPFFATNEIANFGRSQTFNGLQWTGVPWISAFLKSSGTSGGNFLFGGLFQPGATDSPPPAELLQQVLGLTNLVFYDWELTGARSDRWFYIGQFVRYASYREQMQPEFASMGWLKAAAPKLGNCGTRVTLMSPNQLSFVRTSTVGFTALELHLLADWLESPEFPHGLHSLVPAPKEVLPVSPEASDPKNSPEPAARPKQ